MVRQRQKGVFRILHQTGFESFKINDLNFFDTNFSNSFPQPLLNLFSTFTQPFFSTYILNASEIK